MLNSFSFQNFLVLGFFFLFPIIGQADGLPFLNCDQKQVEKAASFLEKDARHFQVTAHYFGTFNYLEDDARRLAKAADDFNHLAKDGATCIRLKVQFAEMAIHYNFIGVQFNKTYETSNNYLIKFLWDRVTHSYNGLKDTLF